LLEKSYLPQWPWKANAKQVTVLFADLKGLLN